MSVWWWDGGLLIPLLVPRLPIFSPSLHRSLTSLCSQCICSPGTTAGIPSKSKHTRRTRSCQATYARSLLHPSSPSLPQEMSTVEPPNNGHVGDEHFVHSSEVVPSSEYGHVYRQGENSLSTVGRLSTLQSVHYQRFHCINNLSSSFFHHPPFPTFIFLSPPFPPRLSPLSFVYIAPRGTISTSHIYETDHGEQTTPFE